MENRVNMDAKKIVGERYTVKVKLSNFRQVVFRNRIAFALLAIAKRIMVGTMTINITDTRGETWQQ